MLGDFRVRYLMIQFVLCFLGWFSVVWFLPHYAAPATAVIFALVVQATRHLRRWEFRGRSVGIGLTRAVVLFAVILAPLHQRGGTLQPVTSKPPTIGYRAKFAADLAAMPGEHLALVRYGVSIDSGEWVYNAADIDHAKVVWAREIPGMDVRPLLDYFSRAARMAHRARRHSAAHDSLLGNSSAMTAVQCHLFFRSVIERKE